MWVHGSLLFLLSFQAPEFRKRMAFAYTESSPPTPEKDFYDSCLCFLSHSQFLPGLFGLLKC